MQLSKSFAALAMASVFLLTGCGSKTLSYQLDPEIQGTTNLAPHATQVSVSVKDMRSEQSVSDKENTIAVLGPKDEAKILQSSLLENLRQNNFKLITNPLLADIGLNFEIEVLSAHVEQKAFYKSEITVQSRIRLKANKKSQTLEKIYRNNLNQEVANPVVESDVTGLVNKLLSKQLQAILNDPDLASLAAK